MSLEKIVKHNGNILGHGLDALIPSGNFKYWEKDRNLLDKSIIAKLADAKESEEVKQLYQGDIQSFYGKSMNFALDKAGKPNKQPDHYVYMDLPKNVIAAVIHLDGKIILAYNSLYAGDLRNNGVLRTYVNMHEHAHIRGVFSESYTEGLVKDAAKYLQVMLGQKYDDISKYVKGIAQQIKEVASLRERYSPA